MRGALDSEDTRVMIAGLNRLGITSEVSDSGRTIQISGRGGRLPAAQADIFVGNSGTTIRFLTALATLGHGTFRLDGVERMRQRPLADLANALNHLGADVTCETDSTCPPVTVRASGLRGGQASVRGDISSQFLSGLLMAAPCAREPVTLKVAGTLVSIPYVSMTLEVMKSFGVSVDCTSDYRRLSIPNCGSYQPCDYQVEPDASAASYFWAAAAITQGEVKVLGLSKRSLQGDVQFVECLSRMGCDVLYEPDAITVVGRPLRAIDVDMNGISDTVQSLAVVALFAEGTTRIRNVAHIRHKETDRIQAVATELRKLGAHVTEHEDGLEITPASLTPATIDTYNDHRMAMSFAVAGLAKAGIGIRHPECTVKTYPNYFDDLLHLVGKRV